MSKAVRALGGTIGAAFVTLGVAELVTHLDDPISLLFWLPALWGGGALVLLAVFRLQARPALSLAFALLGSFTGLLATAWTVVMPVLLFAFVAVVIVQASRRLPAPVPKDG
jgi:hypothetical protein